MMFDLNAYYSVLQQELWVIPFLILIISLNFLKKGTSIRKIIIFLTILFLAFTAYNIYLIFSPLFLFPDHIQYLIRYPYGFVFLFLFILLITSIFYKNNVIKVLSIILLLLVSFNQIYLRVTANKLVEEYNLIRNGKEIESSIFVGTDTTEVFPISNSFGFENDYWLDERIQKNISYTPYLNLSEETFLNFKFPNYYWTKYSDYFTNDISVKLNESFVPPKIIENIPLKNQSSVKEFFLVMLISGKGKLERYSVFPDTIKTSNLNEYLSSLKIIPAYYNNKPVEVSYTKKIRD